MVRSFPPAFLFGCATSAYQIEGNITNDWTAWESAGRLKDPTARNGRATDHWNRWQEDFALLTQLGANAYRLSIEWSRIEPERGQYNDAALDHYARMIRALRELGIEPFVTLLHFTHPPWFHETTPWHDPGGACVEAFAAFARHVAARIDARFWTVLNEPAAWLVGAYVAGLIPPGQKCLRACARAFTNLVRAHARAHAVLKAARSDAQIGVAHNVMRFEPARENSTLDRFVARYVADAYNHALPRALTTGHVRLGAIPGIRIDERVPEAKGTLDFLGVNYYSRVFLRRSTPFYEDRAGYGLSDLGWEIHPRGLTEALTEMSAYGLPLYITENGIDDRDDTRRSAFLYDHLSAMLDAIDRGTDVRGYFHWSLIDNFEWLEAYGPRFGLYRVDDATLERHPTKAAALYKEIIKARALPDRRPDVTPKRGTGPVPLF